MGGVAGIAGCAASFEVSLAGYVAGVSRKTLIAENTRSAVTAIAQCIRLAAFGNAIGSLEIIHQQSFVL